MFVCLFVRPSILIRRAAAAVSHHPFANAFHCAVGASIKRYISVIFAPKSRLSDVTYLLCCAEGATIGRYLSAIFAPKALLLLMIFCA